MSYQEYITHQSQKLNKHFAMIKQYDREYESIVYERYKSRNWEGVSILCVGARLGAEVRAFERLGAMAIGIDLNPGPSNRYVLTGDAHNLRFPDKSFNYIFSNAVDHFLNLDGFLSEARRVVKDQVILEVTCMNPGPYEVNDFSDINTIKEPIKKYFKTDFGIPIHNKSKNIDWHGHLLYLS